MEGNDLTLSILREIRDTQTDLRDAQTDLASRLDAVHTGLSARIDETRDCLSSRLGTVEETLKDLAGQHLMLTRYVKNVVDRHDTEIEDLDGRVTKIATKLDT